LPISYPQISLKAEFNYLKKINIFKGELFSQTFKYRVKLTKKVGMNWSKWQSDFTRGLEEGIDAA
jgi:hypothetical protein